jgi:DNA polymerase I-like protein with 3'-5' exonuclease and polymerase domains
MKEYHVIEDLEGLQALDDYLESSNNAPMAFDFETNGLFFGCLDVGFSISIDPEIAFYVPTRIYKGIPRSLVETPLRSKLLPYLKRWLIRSQRTLVMHNANFDCKVLLTNYGLNAINNVLCDTRLLFKMAVSEDDPAGLKELGVRYFGEDAKDEQNDLKQSVIENGGKWLKDEKDMYMGAKDILAKYGAKDASLTIALFELLYPKLKTEGLWDLWNEETLPLMSVVFKMNTTGFHINVEHFNKLKIEMEKEIEDLENNILNDLGPDLVDYEKELILKKTKIARHPLAKTEITALGYKNTKTLTPDEEWAIKEKVYRHEYGSKSPFSLTSPKDLRWLIYEHFKEPITVKTDTGLPATDKDVINSLAGKYKWAKKLVEKRENEKLLSTYVEGPLRENVNGVVYFDFDQGGTISGRFSTRSGVPIMTLPKGDKRIKRGFEAPPGYKLVVLDYSSLEPHLAAYLSQDPDLIDSFVSGKDFYSVIGIKQFGKHDATPYKDGSPNSFAKKYPDIRDLTKTYALAVLYGAEEYRVAEILHPEATSWDERKVAMGEAGNLIGSYFKAFPGTKKLIDQSHFEAHQYGMVRTKFGRIRHMPLVAEVYKKYGFKLKDPKFAKANKLQDLRREYKNFLNNSVNIQVQGLAAHGCNRAAILIMNEFAKQNIDGYVAIQVHDELGAIVREDQAELAYKIMDQCMANSIDISPIKLKTEGKIGNNLAECK